MIDGKTGHNDARNPYPAALPSARRHYLTIVFSDLSNSTRIAGSVEAEDYADLLDALREAYQAVIPGHGGTIVQINGDGVLAIFGYPETSECDARKATEAALDLHAAVRNLSGSRFAAVGGLRLHTGIHSGLVLVHSGDEVRGRFELLGSATNIASRLSHAAKADEILVSEATLGPERAFFRTSERRYLDLKGKDRPIAAFQVIGRTPVTTRFAATVRSGLTPFIGRETELGALKRGLGEAMAGETRFIAIAAPAGVGKTRLAEELIGHAYAKGCQVHRGECEAGAEPLRPFREILKSIVGDALPPALDPELDAHRPALLHMLGLSPGVERPTAEAIGSAVGGFIGRLTRQVPLLLFIDDWQWADDASRQLMGALRNLGGRLLLLVTERTGPAEDKPIAGAEVLHLAPLSDMETGRTVMCLLPSADPFVVADVCASSGGNPLFIEELCHAVAYGGDEERPHSGTAWLDILIQSRFARLPEARAGLVRTAAVIGTVIPAWLLELTTGRGQEDEDVKRLADEDFIFPGEREGTFRFKHGITRDVIYDSVGLHERQALHLRIADVLRRRGAEVGEEEFIEPLAYHYGAGGDAAKTVHYAELAGNKAMAVSSLDRAQAQYRAALDALDRMPPSDEGAERWGRIAQRFGLAGVFDPSPDQLPVFRRAVERAHLHGDRAALAWAEYWLGYINYALGESARAIGHCERALDAAREVGDDRLAVQIRATLGQARAAACDYERALALLDEAIAVKDRHRTGARPPIGFAYSLACKGFALGDLGRFAEAYACFEEAMAAVRGAQHEVEGSVLCQRSAVCLWQGRMDDALVFAREAEQVSQRVKTLYLYAMSRALGGYARWVEDGAADAVQAIVEATHWLEASGRGQFISLNYGWLADVMVKGGRISEGRRYAARALLRGRKHDRLGEAMACRAMARAAAAGHGRQPAGYYLARAMDAAQVRGAPHEIAANRLCQAEIAPATGDRRGAISFLAQAQPTFAALGMQWHARQAEWLGAELGRPGR